MDNVRQLRMERVEGVLELLGPEVEGYLPVDQWMAMTVNQINGDTVYECHESPEVAWALLEVKLGCDLVPWDEDTARLVSGPAEMAA